MDRLLTQSMHTAYKINGHRSVYIGPRTYLMLFTEPEKSDVFQLGSTDLYLGRRHIWPSLRKNAKNVKWRMIIAVIYAIFAVAKRKPEKKFRLVRDSNPSPRLYRCSSLPIKVTSQLGQFVEMVSYKPVKGWWWSYEYIKTAEWRIKWRMIITVIYATFAVAKRKPEKNSFGIRTSSSFRGFITNQFQRPAPSWLVSLIGRVLHRYSRGQGFESRTSLNF